MLVANDEVTDAFEASIAPLFRRALLNCDAFLTLVGVRDALLPKLISGEIPVGDVETRSEKALAAAG